MLTGSIDSYFYFNRFSTCLAGFILVLGGLIWQFAANYMRGERHYRSFLWQLSLFVISLMLSVVADNLWLLLLIWSLNQFLLVRLMVPHPEWQAAKNAGAYSANYLAASTCCLSIGFAMLNAVTGEQSIHTIIQQTDVSPLMLAGLWLVALAGMVQSAIWPFHRWLLSSLNSPTPVSAIMHAGFINGGVLLIIRFAPLYIQHPQMLNLFFGLGLITLILATLFKLIQQDVKRMLACSTMAQMGFALLQCGLGLFPLAMAHLCWHGFFKANLFLSSASALQEKKFIAEQSPRLSQWLLAGLFGVAATWVFFAELHNYLTWQSQLVFTLIIFITATQLSLSILFNTTSHGLILAFATVMSVAYLYGLTVNLFELIMSPLHLLHPQPVNGWQIVGALVLAGAWLVFLLRHRLFNSDAVWWQRSYVFLLNASQPHATTITTERNQYQY